MGLFQKKKSTVLQTDKSAPQAISSILCKDMHIKGNISFKGKARIDGIVDGDVKGEHLILSTSGRISGDLEVQSLICHGTVEGNINAEYITVHTSATIHGKLQAETLTVESGAALEGEIRAASHQKGQKKAHTRESTPPTAAQFPPAKS